MLALNPVIQIFKPVSPLAWLPISLHLGRPVCHFVIFITSLWPTIINTALASPAFLRIISMWHGAGNAPLAANYKIIWPASLPHIFTDESVWIAWLVIVAVEMLTGGIGIGFCGMNGAA